MDHSLFRYGVVSFVAIAFILGGSAARDLRPSDHGLSYALPPAQNGDAQEMRSFFGSTTSSSSSVQLPEAKNISDTWLSAHAEPEGGARDGRVDHVRLGLLAASAACGLTGVVLLAISGVVFVYRLQRRRPKAEGDSATSASMSLPAKSRAVNTSSG